MIWITGAGGMIGSHMMESFMDQGFPVLGTYYRPTTDLAELGPRAELAPCDVRDADAVDAVVCSRKPDRIFHLAAQSYPAVSWERPWETLETNAGGTVNVFEAVRRVRRVDPSYDPIVVVACSSAEYGSSLDDLSLPANEDVPLQPVHPYGVSKVAQDLLARQYFVNDGIRCIRARIFNTTGTRKVGDVCSDFVRRVVEQESLGVNPIELRVGNVETRRAIMDCRDTVRALALLSEAGEPGRAYNISSAVIFQVKEIIAELENIVGQRFKLRVDPALLRPTDERMIVGDVSALVRDTGWSQKVSLRTTLADMLAYWRAKA